jgi:hypothetical protein
MVGAHEFRVKMAKLLFHIRILYFLGPTWRLQQPATGFSAAHC